jgi:crotonobetainyl-CoA:carnitine CoA-transferase CaiB-like acyl-CoA transferase
MVTSVETEDGPLHLVASPIRFDGHETEYRPPPRLHEHTGELVERPDEEPGQAS